MSRDAIILLAVPDSLVFRGLELVLKAPHYTIRHACTLEAVESAIDAGGVDLLLLDDELADDIFAVLRRYKYRRTPSILLLSGSIHPQFIDLVLKAGARGYVYRADDIVRELPGIVERLLEKTHAMSSTATDALIAYRVAGRPVQLFEIDLTVLRLIDSGYSVKEIGARLNLDSRQVYRVRAKLKTLLGVPGYEHLIAAAREMGLVSRTRYSPPSAKVSKLPQRIDKNTPPK